MNIGVKWELANRALKAEARIAELENRLGAIATSDMNDIVQMGLARDAAEARVRELEAALDAIICLNSPEAGWNAVQAKAIARAALGEKHDG